MKGSVSETNTNLVDTSNKFCRGLKMKRIFTEKLKSITYEYKKACNLG